jgi:hypothetical protein
MRIAVIGTRNFSDATLLAVVHGEHAPSAINSGGAIESAPTAWPPPGRPPTAFCSKNLCPTTNDTAGPRRSGAMT